MKLVVIWVLLIRLPNIQEQYLCRTAKRLHMLQAPSVCSSRPELIKEMPLENHIPTEGTQSFFLSNDGFNYNFYSVIH